MIQDILTLLPLDAQTIVTVLSLSVTTYVVVAFTKTILKKFNSFEENQSTWDKRIEDKFLKFESVMTSFITDTRKVLADHSSDMERATKDLSFELQKSKSNLIDLRQEFFVKIDSLREIANYLEREFKIIAASMKTTTDHFEEKFGRVISIRAELEATYSRLIHLESDSKDLKSQYAKHTEWFNHIAQTLNQQKEDIRTLLNH